MSGDAFADLMAHQAETEALSQIMGRLGWDQETMMPDGAADQRGAEMAALEAVLHARRSDPRLGEWLARATPPDATGAAQLREIARQHARATLVPARLATALARETSLAQGIWARARKAEDPAAFLPALTRVLDLRREEGAALAEGGIGGGDVYDALLDDYEPGARAGEISALFDRMRPRLVALCAAVADTGRDPGRLSGHFPRDAQLALARDLAEAFGYDFNRGRIDIAVHPFSSGSGADVRVTTRVDEGEPLDCLYSTLHEVGHAVYEQSVDPALALTALGQGASMGVHESQSRLFENQIGRSEPFAGWLHGRMRDRFGAAVPEDPGQLYAILNRVAPGYIRTEADELHYNLHVMLRFDLERALVAGDLQPGDLEAAWNDRFEADFGLKVDRPSRGFLQDVHWSVGLFGYFPTYALGNVYAGCLFAALRRDLPGLDGDLARGDLAAVNGWLGTRLRRHGAAIPAGELIAGACGFVPDETALLDALEEKYGSLYAL